MRTHRVLSILIVVLLLLPTLALPAAARTVTPGAFCARAEAGTFGRTTTGLLMQCTTTATDSRLRWREFGSAFGDTKGNTHEQNIAELYARGITRGCDAANLFYCPRNSVTRQQMAAFMVRSLGLTDGNHPGFRDVAPGSTFDQDIRRLAKAGITLGCNPPANDRFCPRDAVTRQQMAAFMARGLGLTDADHPGFRDVPPGSTFDQDIRRLARAGITRGCNPPANDRFCPRDAVRRDQMASFLIRGLPATP
jgi:hypothetical protein